MLNFKEIVRAAPKFLVTSSTGPLFLQVKVCDENPDDVTLSNLDCFSFVKIVGILLQVVGEVKTVLVGKSSSRTGSTWHQAKPLSSD